MVTLHNGTGSRQFDVCREVLSTQEHESLMLNARQVLRARSENLAAELLVQSDFRVCEGMNDFADEFHVLYASVPLAEYERYRSIAKQPEIKRAFGQIADVLTEIGRYIRFIAVELEQASPESWDVFICHANEDKAEVAEPLYSHLDSIGIRCWYDDGEILWGDSIVEKINEGLGRSRFVIVVVSLSLFDKRWATKEMYAALSHEIDSGTSRVLPLMVGTDEDVQRMQGNLAIQRDKRYLRWSGNPEHVEKELRALLRREQLKGTS